MIKVILCSGLENDVSLSYSRHTCPNLAKMLYVGKQHSLHFITARIMKYRHESEAFRGFTHKISNEFSFNKMFKPRHISAFTFLVALTKHKYLLNTRPEENWGAGVLVSISDSKIVKNAQCKLLPVEGWELCKLALFVAKVAFKLSNQLSVIIE